MNAICDTMEGDFLKEPEKEDWKLIAEEFQLKWSFPMCVGAIDGNVYLYCATDNQVNFLMCPGFAFGKSDHFKFLVLLRRETCSDQGPCP